MLRSRRIDRDIPSAPDTPIGCGNPPAPEAQQCLEIGHRLMPTVVQKYELFQVDLELAPTHTMMSAHEPHLEIPGSASANGTTDWPPC